MKHEYGHRPYRTFTEMVKALVSGGEYLPTASTGALADVSPSSAVVTSRPEREDLLQYIDRIRNFFTDSWKANYRQVWGEIIDNPTVSAIIYNKGRKVGTTFNRDLVGNIINYLGHHGMINKWNASQITIALENTKEHSVRMALGIDPPANIIEVLKTYTNQKTKKK